MSRQETSELRRADRSLDIVERTLERFVATADVGKAFGTPVEKGDATIIPASEVLAAMGVGVGSGGGTDTGEAGEHSGGGGGGGGGGSIVTRPVAVVVATPGGVKVEPVVDLTKIAVAAITAGGFMLATWLGMSRPKLPRA